jgi:very-short-patch-repair endonuclease
MVTFYSSSYQQVIAGLIVEFYCHQAGLVVEVDGDFHDLQKEEDEQREKVLSEMGLRIVRFRNDEVMKSLSTVLGKIKEFTPALAPGASVLHNS